MDCLHLEAKITGSSACKRAGISHPKDLLDFDFDGFWKRYLTFVDVDRRRLGRWYLNQINGTKERLKEANGYDINRATGNYLFRFYGRDQNGDDFLIQNLIDAVGRGPFPKYPLSYYVVGTNPSNRPSH